MRKMIGAALALVVGLVGSACFDWNRPSPLPSQTTTVIVNQTQGGGVGAPAGTPPVGGQNGTCAGSPDRVLVGFYGFDHCSNAPANKGGELPLGCEGLATVTPKVANSNTNDTRFDATTPVWRVTSGPAQVVSPGAEDNAFNAFISWQSGTAVGQSATVEATVCGKPASFTFKAT